MNDLLVSLTCFVLTLGAVAPSGPAHRLELTPEAMVQGQKWLHDLYEMGMRVEGDSVRVSVESRRVMTDSSYRKVIYPKAYEWAAVKPMIEAHQLKIAVWYLINLYDAESGIDVRYREAALKMLAALDGPFEMDKAVLGAFYTYGLLDPRVCSWESGRREITRPDLAEKRLNVVKDLVDRIVAYRDIKQQKPDSTHDGIPSGGER